MNNSSEARRQINNELKARSHNQQAKKTLEQITPEEIKDELKIDFYCECSDETCTSRVPMTLEEYDTLHNTPARFVITTGHHSPMVEKVTKIQADRAVVEKYAL